MKNLIRLMQVHSLDALAVKVNTQQYTNEDIEVLKAYAFEANEQFNARVEQIQSISKAVKAASMGGEGSGIYDQELDGFNFAGWVNEEVQTLQAIRQLEHDVDGLLFKVKGGEL